MARNAALRRAGPPVVAGLALLLGGITVWYAWVVARHLRDDARQTSTLLGRVFAGLNDPRPDAATDALLDLARQVRSLGIAIVVMDTAGHITALDNAPPEIGADTAQLRARSEEHTSELQSLTNLVCRLLLEKKKTTKQPLHTLTHHTRTHNQQ